jgi:hypothetical protein
MLKPLVATVVSLALCSSAAAADARGLWCSPGEPEIAVNADGVSFVDHNCRAQGVAFRLGKVVPMQCSGDDGGYDTKLRVTLSGDTLTVVEDDLSTTYTRCD